MVLNLIPLNSFERYRKTFIHYIMKEFYIIRVFINGEEQREYAKVVRREKDAFEYVVSLNHLLYDDKNVLKLNIVRV